MKKLLIITAALVMASCADSPVDKPEHLLSREEMTNVLYDVALVQAVNSAALGNDDIKPIDLKAYLKQKYGLDSLSFVQNHRYYAADLEQYQKMQDEIRDRLKQEGQLGQKAAGNAKTGAVKE